MPSAELSPILKDAWSSVAVGSSLPEEENNRRHVTSSLQDTPACQSKPTAYVQIWQEHVAVFSEGTQKHGVVSLLRKKDFLRFLVFKLCTVVAYTEK